MCISPAICCILTKIRRNYLISANVWYSVIHGIPICGTGFVRSSLLQILAGAYLTNHLTDILRLIYNIILYVYTSSEREYQKKGNQQWTSGEPRDMIAVGNNIRSGTDKILQ